MVLKGSGENGKSTVIDGVRGAAGVDYAIPLPDRVLLARTGDHPTELMTLRDARLAFMEEFPELGHLNVKRLKDLTGTEWMTARLLRQGHRALAGDALGVRHDQLPAPRRRVRPRHLATAGAGGLPATATARPTSRSRRSRDRPGDPGLRERLRGGEDGQHEAVLAWLIDGAVRWYRNGQTMPEPPASVVEATAAWRRSADVLLRYCDDRLVFDTEAHVMCRELYEDFTDWLKEHGHVVWTDQNFSARFGQHPEVTANGVEKKKESGRPPAKTFPPTAPLGDAARDVPEQYAAWLGVRFRTPTTNRKKRDDQGRS